jgi:hypothetical protein
LGLIALFLGVILIVAAVRDSQGALFSALEQDVPKFVIWGAAILAVGAIGAIPGLKGPSRLLLALVITVLIVNNYQKLIKGFQNAWQKPPAPVSAQTASGGSADGQATGAASATSPPDFLQGFLDSNPFGDFLEAPQ